MMKRAILVIIMMISIFGLFSFKNTSRDIEEVKTSYVSFYHDKFNGRKTASGEIFHNEKFTAAHRTLPFGTKVMVTNMKNNDSVVVVINDRGPFHSSRALDLSKAAFGKISNVKNGIVAVKYRIMK